jgi:hypothetical protein
METTVSFDIAHTALVAMDCQTAIVAIYAKPPEEFTERCGCAPGRTKGMMLVVHVQVGFRPGLPEVISRNKLLAAIKSSSQRQSRVEASISASFEAGPRGRRASERCLNLRAVPICEAAC